MSRKATVTIKLVPAAVELARFIKANGIGPTRAARELRVKHPSLLAWLSGRSRPGDHHRKAIEVWTSGRIKETAWMTSAERAQLAGVSPFAEGS